ncbi:MAG: hypothetical protein JNM90_06235 [Burkholderiales bacterium]|nr:hypothetical protein [Burkholderiales bacterium]
MKADAHRQRALRIEASLARLGAADWEMRIEAAMLAGTHWANCALHRHGVAPEAEDIVHTSMLVVNTLRKYAIVEPDLLRDLGEIEELRPLYVRGDVPGGAAAADRAVALLAAIRARAERAGC